MYNAAFAAAQLSARVESSESSGSVWMADRIAQAAVGVALAEAAVTDSVPWHESAYDSVMDALSIKVRDRGVSRDDLRKVGHRTALDALSAKPEPESASAVESDLLTALEGLVADWERVHGPMARGHEALVAIAKAKGRTA